MELLGGWRTPRVCQGFHLISFSPAWLLVNELSCHSRSCPQHEIISHSLHLVLMRFPPAAHSPINPSRFRSEHFARLSCVLLPSPPVYLDLWP